LDDIPNCLKAEEFDQFVKPRLDLFLEPGLKPKNLRNWKYALVRTDPTMVFDNGSPLLFAIRNDLSQLASIMFRRLPDINQYCFGNGLTCLTVAAEHSALFTVVLLLELGAEVDFPTKDRRLTALHFAAENADKVMVEFLLDAGASIHSRSNSRSTPFYRAARGGSVEILELLYNRGSELDVKTWDNWTPLMEAIESDHEPAIELLLKWGADPTNCSTYGTTPLILAHASRFGSIKKLVEDAILRWTTANIVQEELSS
jgi:ankyrin repeat protein